MKIDVRGPERIDVLRAIWHRQIVKPLPPLRRQGQRDWSKGRPPRAVRGLQRRLPQRSGASIKAVPLGTAVVFSGECRSAAGTASM